jgi:GAF domain-containing protein
VKSIRAVTGYSGVTRGQRRISRPSAQFAIRDGSFRTNDSAADPRLDGHPYQGVMVSYHGVPIMMNGEIWGTMCHFDLAKLPLAEDEFELLRDAAAAVAGSAITA